MIKIFLFASLVFGQECFRVEKIEKVACPSTIPSSSPTPLPTPTPKADCAMLPQLNYDGFQGWLGWKRIAFSQAEVKRLCFNVSKDQTKLSISVVDSTGPSQCWSNDIKVWNPMGELIKDTSKSGRLSGPNSFTKFSPDTLIEKGMWKFEVIENSKAIDCNRGAQITVH